MLKNRCAKGHDMLVVGRHSTGRCLLCYREKYPPKPRTKKLCSNGHDKDLVGRYGVHGHCRTCTLEAASTKLKLRTEEERKKVYRTTVSNMWKRKGITNADGSPFTLEDYEFHFSLQNGRCKLQTCNKHQSELGRAFDVDHDHVTKIVRGLLCSACNRNLVSEHTLETAVALTRYLKGNTHPAPPTM